MQQDIMSEIRNRYISENLLAEDAPDLSEYAEEYCIDFKLVLAAADKGNWQAHRNRRKRKLQAELSKAEDNALQRVAVDVVNTQADLLRKSIDVILHDIPKVRDELMARIEDMGDKELVAFYKILLDVKKQTFDILLTLEKIKSEPKEKDKPKVNDKENPILHLGKLMDVINQKPGDDVEADREEAGELFSKIDAARKT
jgi:hypothetical protein